MELICRFNLIYHSYQNFSLLCGNILRRIWIKNYEKRYLYALALIEMASFCGGVYHKRYNGEQDKTP
ncbi:hypothetical protein [Flavobacterium sp. RS13.1]|uniref:hypothetical protein n=1 Tax=Flavobacterium sp. RS13.1 TaxID=3400345 RepID=UPI003AB103DD